LRICLLIQNAPPTNSLVISASGSRSTCRPSSRSKRPLPHCVSFRPNAGITAAARTIMRSSKLRWIDLERVHSYRVDQLAGSDHFRIYAVSGSRGFKHHYEPSALHVVQRKVASRTTNYIGLWECDLLSACRKLSADLPHGYHTDPFGRPSGLPAVHGSNGGEVNCPTVLKGGLLPLEPCDYPYVILVGE